MKPKSQQIVELIGPPLVWHEPVERPDEWLECSCGSQFRDVRLYRYHFASHQNPNYESDPIALLKVMMETNNIHRYAIGEKWPIHEGHYCVPLHYLYTPGLLASAVIEYLGGKK